MKSVEANEAGETMRVKLAAAEAEVERLRAALDLAGDLSKVEARAEQAEAERDTLRDSYDAAAAAWGRDALRAELLCRDALIKDHLARILHLENRVDAEAHRAEKAEAALRDLVRGAEITFADERIGYEEIQVDRGTLARARAFLAPEEKP